MEYIFGLLCQQTCVPLFPLVLVALGIGVGKGASATAGILGSTGTRLLVPPDGICFPVLDELPCCSVG